MPWLRTLASFPSYSALAHMLPTAWTVFTTSSSQNVQIGGGYGSEVQQKEQLDQLQLSREQRMEGRTGGKRSECEGGDAEEEEDRIDDS